MRKLNLQNENNKILFQNVIGSLLLKGGALIVSLLTMPAFISYFGDQAVLGVWFTVLSVITWILNFDLGIGNGLRNHLVKSIAENDANKSRALISSAYLMIGVIVAVILVVGYASSTAINWNGLFNISEVVVSPLIMLWVVRYIFMGIMIQFFLKLISSILYALQQSAINNLIALIISVAQLLFVLFAPSGTPQDNLLLLSKAYIFITGIPYLFATIIVFRTKLRGVSPQIHCCEKESIKQVMSVGGIFFLCQILYMIIVNTNDFFVTTFTLPENTVDYNIYNRLFSLAGTLVMLLLTPIWSMVTKAIAEGQYEWLKKLYKKARQMTFWVIIAELLLLVLLQPIINIWLNEDSIKVNYLYALAFAVWGAVFVYHNVLSTFTCGLGRMTLQAVCYGIGVVVKIVILLIIFQYTDSWIWVVLTNLIIITPYCILQDRSTLKYLKGLDEKKDYV